MMGEGTVTGFPDSLAAYRYTPRTIAFQGARTVGRWRVKCTVITVRGSAAHFADEVEAAWAVAASLLGGVPDRCVDAGIGFLTVHVGLAGVWLLLDWWEEANMLRHRHFRASIDDPTAFRDVGAEHYGPCVWELAVQAHERGAWLRHVIANPAGPDLDGYLGDGMAGVV